MATDTQGYAHAVGNKALAGTTARAIAAQHVAFATKREQGVTLAEACERAWAVGWPLRPTALLRSDATYSTRNTPVASRSGAIGAVHTFRMSSALDRGARIACDAAHKGSNTACKASAPNTAADERTYRLDDCADFATLVKNLDKPATMRAAAVAAFGALVTAAIRNGYDDAERLAATPSIAWALARDAAYVAAYDAATASLRGKRKGKAAKAAPKRTSARKARKAAPVGATTTDALDAPTDDDATPFGYEN